MSVWMVSSYVVVLGRKVGYDGYARIHCYGSDGQSAVIYFVRPEDSLPNNMYYEPKKQATMFLPAEQFSWYVDLLRNEEPILAMIDPDDPMAHEIRTGAEPPGEGE